jgi:hypothetical protein
MVTLDEALDTVDQLPVKQQDMLIEILWRRQVERRRAEIALDAETSLKDYYAGALRPMSAESVIAELRQELTRNIDEDDGCENLS